jgi:hypothetical protein
VQLLPATPLPALTPLFGSLILSPYLLVLGMIFHVPGRSRNSASKLDAVRKDKDE